MTQSSSWASITSNASDYLILASVDSGATPSTLAATLTAIATTSPNLNVDSRSEYRDRLIGQIDQLLAAVNMLVALAVIIALLGITNTLGLAVFERT